MSSGSPPGRGSAASGRSAELVRERRMAEPLNITLRYVGGAEGWIEVRFRGLVRRFPGHWDLLHVVQELNAERWAVRPLRGRQKG